MLAKEELIGTWLLESWTIGYADRDDLSYPFGEEPQGQLIYSADGWMSAAIYKVERPLFPEDTSPHKVDPTIQADAYASYFHYAGRFEVQDNDVLHYVTQSLNPNFVGSRQLRHAELDGRTLVLSGKDEAAGTTRFHSLVWHRSDGDDQFATIES